MADWVSMVAADSSGARGVERPPGIGTPLWPIGGVAVTIVMGCAWIWTIDALEVERYVYVNRALARLSFLLFIPIFTAKPLARWAPGATTRGLVRIRRSLGLAYALVMGAHAVAIVLGARAAESMGLEEFDYARSSVGAMGFLMIAAMAATSNDAAVRRMGGKAWRRLHATGIWVLWSFYLVTYLSRLGDGKSEYWPGLVMVGLLALVRWSVRLRRGRGGTEATTGDLEGIGR